MRLRGLAFLFLAGVLFGTNGCGSEKQTRRAKREFRRSFSMVFERYRTFEGSKALALARDEEGRWAYGFARGQESNIEAVNAAKEQCKSRRRHYAVAVPCRTYAVGDRITGDPSWAAPPGE